MKNPFQFFDPNKNELHTNSLGYSQLITTLTAVGKKVSEQKFYEIDFAEYVPTVIGNGAFQSSIINWRTFVKGEDFETGVMGNASNAARLPLLDAAFDQLPATIYSWAKGIIYNVFELEQAMQANQIFSLIESREKARAKQWQLGLQKVAFLGYSASKGLLNQSTVAVNSTTITKRLGDMSAAEFNTFVGEIYGVYRVNCNYTAKPTHFIIPEKDFNSLVNYGSETMFTRTKLELLLEAFKTITGNAGFKILPCAYCDKANFDTTNNRYVLLNYDDSSVVFNIPVDYTMTQSGTINGFNFENAGFGQFSGVVCQREKEMLYFGNTAT